MKAARMTTPDDINGNVPTLMEESIMFTEIFVLFPSYIAYLFVTRWQITNSTNYILLSLLWFLNPRCINQCNFLFMQIWWIIFWSCLFSFLHVIKIWEHNVWCILDGIFVGKNHFVSLKWLILLFYEFKLFKQH